MSKKLIERLRAKTIGVYSILDLHNEAADLIESQQKRIDDLEAEIERKISAGNYVIEQLTTTQAQNKVLREALENVEGALYESGMYQDYPVTYDLVLEALDQPTDDSALCEMLKAEMERCIIELHRNADKPIDEIVSAIRAMGSES